MSTEKQRPGEDEVGRQAREALALLGLKQQLEAERDQLVRERYAWPGGQMYATGSGEDQRLVPPPKPGEQLTPAQRAVEAIRHRERVEREERVRAARAAAEAEAASTLRRAAARGHKRRSPSGGLVSAGRCRSRAERKRRARARRG